MGKLSDKAKKIDMYASLPPLTFGKDSKINSNLGLLLTFLTVVIIGGMAIWLGIKIFGRQTPSFVQYELPAQGVSPKLEWNTDDFKFGIMLDGTTNSPYVSPTAKYIQAAATTIPVVVGWCYIMDYLPGQRFDCPYRDESSKVKTYLDTEGYWSFQIDYEYCTDFGCYAKEDSKQYLKDNKIKFIFVYEDLLIDPFNYENPVSTTTTSITDLFLLDIGRTLVITLNEVEFISDNGWIFQDLKTEKKLKATMGLKVSDADILRIQFTYGGTKTIYKRTYPKIQDFLAQVSGFITILTPIFFILAHPYANLKAVQQMTNEIYEIKLNKPNKGNSSPQRSLSSKKKRLSLKYKSSSSRAESPTSPAKETQVDLLSKTSFKKGIHLSSMHSRNPSGVPHTTLGIQPTETQHKEEESIIIPQESERPFSPIGAFNKSPSSPFKASLKLSSRNDDHEKLIVESPKASFVEKVKPEDEKLNENPEPKEEEIENKSPAEESSESEKESEEEEEEEVPLRSSDSLEVSWLDWLISFFKPSPKVRVLYKAKEHILETFDLVTLSKKVVEIDKLKACLLTHDERVIFENLPSSVIVLDPTASLSSEKAIQQYHWKESFKGDEAALRKAYARLKGTKKKLGRKLIRLYESEYLNDGDGDAMVPQVDP